MVALTEQQVFDTIIHSVNDNPKVAEFLTVERTLRYLFPSTKERDFHNAYVMACEFYGLSGC